MCIRKFSASNQAKLNASQMQYCSISFSCGQGDAAPRSEARPEAGLMIQT